MKLFCILGAGASIDSGLSTYRGPQGLYKDTNTPEQILNANTAPAELWAFLTPLYQKIAAHQPGATYDLLKQLVDQAEKSLIVTQNIDNYAESCGQVVNIHGTCDTMRCIKCNQIHSTNLDRPKCSCGEWCRPNIVLFGEDLNHKEYYQVLKFIQSKPTYTLVVGTSLQFQYLINFIDKAKRNGSVIIHINTDAHYQDVKSDEMFIQKTSAEGLQDVLKII